MNILRFDSVGGASGDMILAALIDLGADPEKIRTALTSLNIGIFSIETSRDTHSGISGTRVTVTTDETEHHHARHLSDIIGLLKESDMEEAVIKDASSVFTILAKAEAAVHGCSIEEVHFHEVGAVDSIVDIVGSCLAKHMLGVSDTMIGPLPVGQGTMQVAHGTMPIPAPATAELLKGHDVVQTDEPFELVTPTGAAILTAWSSDQRHGPGATLTLANTGFGIGHRTLRGRPNLIRASLMSIKEPSRTAPESCLVLECNVDDTIPELLGALTCKLMDMGALDVFTTAVQMKKQRHGMLLTVLCGHEDRDRMIRAIFEETTTFGIREHAVSRAVLERRHVDVQTPYGSVRLKVGSLDGSEITRTPEYEDCAALAGKKGVPIRSVYEAALRAGTS